MSRGEPTVPGAPMLARTATAAVLAVRIRAVLAAVLLLGLPACAPLAAQPADAGPEGGTTSEFLPALHIVAAPYAGKYEARIGGSRESANSKLRLDIGASVDLLRLQMPGRYQSGRDTTEVSIGADFFTWTRLRSTASFKFPVEAVDYYFGLSAATRWGRLWGARLRVAHISAHLVDGDPSFTNPAQQYMTYSREFADAMLAYGHTEPADNGVFGVGRGLLGARAYGGALAMFHSIPDTLGMVTPYAGVELCAWPRGEAWGVRLGYESRINTELDVVAEHLARVGLMLGQPGRRGLSIEFAYFRGRSHYGQHFSVMEEYTSLGFAVVF